MIARTITCPIILGRDDVSEQLRQAFMLARSSQGQVALITGEAGIGKSRLVEELQRGLKSLQDAEPFVFRANCYEVEQSLPYAPIVDMLRTGFTADPSLRQRVNNASYLMDLARLFPELAAVSDASGMANAASGGADTVDNAPAKRQLQQAVIHFMAEQSASRTVLAIVEDIHWCDGASLDFLLAWARRLSSQRILLVLTLRDEETVANPALPAFLTDLARERVTTEYRLPALSAETIGQMARAIFGDPFTRRHKFIDAIYNLTEGNPFFVEEILKALVASGDIYASGSEWKLKSLVELHVPRTVQISIQQRISQLSGPARRILSLAAVAGREFDFRLLQHLTGLAEGDLIQIIRELRDAQFVTEQTADRFAFRHALIRQVVYQDLLLREQRAQHQAVGAALEALYGSDPAYLSDIAYHYFRAEEWEACTRRSLQAAAYAQSLYAPGLALEHYNRAVDALQRLGQVPTPDLWRRRGQLNERVGKFDAARDDYMSPINAAQQAAMPELEWQGWLDLAWLWTERNFALAGEYFGHVLALARHVEATPLLVQTLNRVGNWHLHADQLDEGVQYHHQALAIAEQIGDLHGQAEALDLLGISSFYLGDVIGGTDYYARAVALWRQLGDLSGLSSSLQVMSMRGASYNLDTVVCPAVPPADSLREAEEAVDAARKLGWRAGEASALIYCGFSLGPRGNLGRAALVTRAGLDLALEIEHLQWAGAAQLVLGAVYRDLLAFDLAREQHESVYRISQDLQAPLLRRMVAGHLATTYVACGQPELAEKVLAEFFSHGQSQTATASQPILPMISIGQRLVWCARVELLLANDQPDDALDILRSLLTNRRPDSGSIPRLDYLLGLALARLGQQSAAEKALRSAEAAAEAQGLLALRWKILLAMGETLQTQGRHDLAEEAFLGAQQVIETIAATITDATLRERFLTGAAKHLHQHYRPSPRAAAKRAFGGLTARERDVATLIAQGKSNRSIAEVLTLSERTVAKHVENIFTKLNATSRAQVAAWAVESGLGSNEVAAKRR